MPARGVHSPALLAALLLAGCDSLSSPDQPPAELTTLEHAISGAQAITAGENHSCAIRPNRTVVCWGRNKERQLGGGTAGNQSRPVQVTGLAGAVSVAAGRFHTCAILADGTGRCWGSNSSGQLGNVGGSTSSGPVAVTGLSGAVQISVGALCPAQQRHGAVLGEQSLGPARQRVNLQQPGPCAGLRPDQRGGHHRRSRSHLRRLVGGRAVLGQRYVRPAGQRRGRQQEQTGDGLGCLGRVEDRWGRESHLRAADQRHGALLGVQRLRPDRRWNPHQPLDRCRGDELPMSLLSP
jgi:hypothetical protein